eukprot:1923155-Pleurochrysis_carterae.AAC.1
MISKSWRRFAAPACSLHQKPDAVSVTFLGQPEAARLACSIQFAVVREVAASLCAQHFLNLAHMPARTQIAVHV